MAHSCVNKHGRFAQGWSFERNVILNFSARRWHIPWQQQTTAPIWHTSIQSDPCFFLSCMPESAESSYRPENEWGRWLNLPTSRQSHFWHLQFTWRSSLIPPCWAGGRREESCWKAIKERSIGSAAFGAQWNIGCFCSNTEDEAADLWSALQIFTN